MEENVDPPNHTECSCAILFVTLTFMGLGLNVKYIKYYNKSSFINSLQSFIYPSL